MTLRIGLGNRFMALLALWVALACDAPGHALTIQRMLPGPIERVLRWTQRHPAVASLRPLYDPQMKRVKS